MSITPARSRSIFISLGRSFINFYSTLLGPRVSYQFFKCFGYLSHSQSCETDFRNEYASNDSGQCENRLRGSREDSEAFDGSIRMLCKNI
jgi:hypothetical protein